eukprot:2663780-Rhodomonas_salina.1
MGQWLCEEEAPKLASKAQVPTPQNQIQETAYSVQIAPGMRFLVFEFAVDATPPEIPLLSGFRPTTLRCLVLRYAFGSAVCGTEEGCYPLRIGLRAWYVMCGTEIGYAATRRERGRRAGRLCW